LKTIKDLQVNVLADVRRIAIIVAKIANTVRIVNVLGASKKIKTEAIINYGLVL
jgi:hypothetical protein